MHAELRRPDNGSEGEWVIKDNNSTNGVFVNNVRVQTAHIMDGDLIVLGCGANIPMGGQLTEAPPLAVALTLCPLEPDGYDY